MGAFLVGGGRSLYYMCLDCFNGYIFLVEVNTGISEIIGICEKVGGGEGNFWWEGVAHYLAWSTMSPALIGLGSPFQARNPLSGLYRL